MLAASLSFIMAASVSERWAWAEPLPGVPSPPGITWWVASPLEQVFPDARSCRSPSQQRAAKLEAARGEWEPFQIVVRGPLAGVRAQAGPLDREGGGRIAAPRLYRVGYLDVKTPSSIEGHAGRWPDPLLPDVDGFVGERRNAFPFTVPAGEARALWVEVYVPHEAQPGRYRGVITIAASGHDPARVPVELLVHRFELPRSSSLPVTFGFDAHALARLHPALSPTELAVLARRYGVAALRHRISLHGGTMDPPDYAAQPDGKVRVDFRSYDAEVGPFLDGTADAGGPAEGARWSAFVLRLPWRLDDAQLADYARQVVAHLRERGWLSRVFDYTWDEPPPEKDAAVRTRSERVHALAPEVPRLVTSSLTPGLRGAVDIWCPVVNQLDDKPDHARLGFATYPGRAAYAPLLAAGARLWWYQSCLSHGCDGIGGAYFTGWPSLVVDAPAVAHRVFEWLSYRYRVGGELYYATDEAYAHGLDPWRDQYLHGGNGDGTLFYPGDAVHIGGKTPVPVASIRLALIREGLEDYEYLRLHEARYGRAATLAIVDGVVTNTHHWSHRAADYYAARHRLAAELDAAPSAHPTHRAAPSP